MNYINVFIALCISAFFSFMLGRTAPTLVHGAVGHLAVFAASFTILLFVIRGRAGGYQRQRTAQAAPPRAQISARLSSAQGAEPIQEAPADANRRIDVKADLQPDSSVLVVVTVSGVSGAEFKKRIRPRLERVNGIKWKHPTNLGDGARKMEGTIKPGTRADLAVAAVRSIS